MDAEIAYAAQTEQAQGVLDLWLEGLSFLAQIHSQGQCLSQAFARNIVRCADGQLGAIDFEDDPSSALPLALPVLAAAAHVALAAALVAVARALTGGASALTDAAVRGWVAVVCTQLLVLAAPYGLTRDEPPSTSTMLLLLLLAAVAGLVGVLVLVRVTRQVALAARGHGSLPTATLRGS